MAFDSGLLCCYDAKNSFSFVGIIEKDSQRFAFSNMLQIQVKVLEDREDVRNDFKSRDFLNQTFESDTGVGRAFSKAYKVLYTSSPNSLRL